MGNGCIFQKPTFRTVYEHSPGVFPRHLMAEFGGISEMEKISWRMSSSKKEAFFLSGGYLVVLIKRADL